MSKKIKKAEEEVIEVPATEQAAADEAAETEQAEAITEVAEEKEEIKEEITTEAVEEIKEAEAVEEIKEAEAAETVPEEISEPVADEEAKAEENPEVIEYKPVQQDVPVKKRSKLLVTASYFALMLGVVMLVLDFVKIDFVTYISNFMTYGILAIVAYPFIKGKKKGWMIAYIVAVVLLAAFTLIPFIMDIVKATSDGGEAKNIVSLINGVTL